MTANHLLEKHGAVDVTLQHAAECVHMSCPCAPSSLPECFAQALKEQDAKRLLAFTATEAFSKNLLNKLC